MVECSFTNWVVLGSSPVAVIEITLKFSYKFKSGSKSLVLGILFSISAAFTLRVVVKKKF